MTPPAEAPIERHRLFRWSFFALFALTAWQCHLILANFYVALMGSGLLAVIVYPLHAALNRRCGGRPNLAAAVTTLGVALVVVLPTLFGGWVAAKQAAKIAPVVTEWLHSRGYAGGLPTADILPPRVMELWERAAGPLRERGVDPSAWLVSGVEDLSASMTGFAGSALRHVVFFLFQVAVLVFSLFFILRDGPKVFRRAVELIPLPEEHKATLVDRLSKTVSAVLRGIFVVAGVQGLLAAIGYWLFHVPFAVLLGALTAFMGPVPFVGTAAVWVPISVGMVLAGSVNNGLGVAVWCLVVVATTDNILRPILIGAEAKLPMLFLFFGMMGGLHVYGFSGIIVGPVVVALFLALIDIYRREYRWLLAPQKEDK